jgi:hypothetical protein
MAAILLHDYELRMSNFGNAFMLSAITARMAQALQINLEHSTDILCQDSGSSPDASTKESRRRLMWCCYISDSLVGSGVDQLTLIKETDIKIQLPSNERNFLLQRACVTEVLEPGQFLKFLEQHDLPSNPADNMGTILLGIIPIPTAWAAWPILRQLCLVPCFSVGDKSSSAVLNGLEIR